MIIQFLKKNWEYLLIVVLAIALFSSMRSCTINKSTVDLLTLQKDSTYQVAQYYKNKNGELIGQVNTFELTIDQWKNHAEDLGFERDQLKMDNKKLKNLVAHWQGQAEMDDTIQVVLYDTVYIDNGVPVIGKAFDWNNKYLYLNGAIDTELKNITIGYSYNVDFSLTAYRKPQRGFWKPPGQLVADIYFSDPNLTVSTFKGFVIKEDPKKWYETTGFKIGVGALGGIAAYKWLTK